MPDTEMQARRIVLAARPQGEPRASDFRFETVTLDAPADGQVLLKAVYLSLDPYMRGRMNDSKSYAASVPLGGVMVGEGVARVVVSRAAGFVPGDLVLARVGWATGAVLDAKDLVKIDPHLAPIETRLGVLGMPGFTAYAGLREIGRPKKGETVVVAAASGPVGSLVGQLARRAGARAVGIAGGPGKCAFVKDTLGFDAVIDHRAGDLPQALAAACPNGVDVYFENVGGLIWDAVFPLLNTFARIPVCGLIADYNGTTTRPGSLSVPDMMRGVLSKRLTLRGFINYDLEPHRADFMKEVGAGLKDGSIVHIEDIVDGFDQMPEAFMGMLKGRNFGKVLVRVAENE